MRAERADLAVVGAGPAGLTAATVAARRGARVLVVDESPAPGGRLPLQLHEEPGAGSPPSWRLGSAEARALADAATAAGARIVSGASVWGVFPGWDLYVSAVDPADPGRVPDRVSAAAVLLATGASQHPLALPGWTLPGVLCAGAAQMLVNVHRVRPGRRAVVVGVDPLALTLAQQLVLAGVEVPGILPPAPGPFILGAESPPATLRRLSRFAALAPSAGLRLAAGLVQGVGVEGLAARLFPREGITLWGVPLLLRRAATAVVGDRAVAGIRVADLDAAGRVTGREEEWPLDVVVTSAGLAPLVELAQLAGVDVVEVPELGGHVPLCGPDGETRVPGVFVAGSATGVVGASVAVAQGRIAGLGICRELGLIPRGEATRELETARAALTEARRHALPFLPDVHGGLRRMAERWAASAR